METLLKLEEQPMWSMKTSSMPKTLVITYQDSMCATDTLLFCTIMQTGYVHLGFFKLPVNIASTKRNSVWKERCLDNFKKLIQTGSGNWLDKLTGFHLYLVICVEKKVLKKRVSGVCTLEKRKQGLIAARLQQDVRSCVQVKSCSACDLVCRILRHSLGPKIKYRCWCSL